MKATRKPSKGGLPNAMFVQAAVEDLPEELKGIANKIHINFPWGSLLRAVATGDQDILRSLRCITAPDGLLEIIIGLDPERDKAQIERLEISDLTPSVVHSYVVSKYNAVGFDLLEHRVLHPTEWSKLDTSWARRLQGNQDREVIDLIFQARGPV
jgi:16S rRNA (adenine(1408)-N(1))-methyltransferase